MLVSHRYRFVHAKTRKTASTSVESYFEPLCMADGEWTRRHYREEYESAAGVVGYRGPRRPSATRWWNHMPAALIRERLGAERWDLYFKFCVIRNPFEKAVSAYYHATCLGPAAQRRPGTWSDDDPERFAAWLARSPALDDRDVFCIDGRFALDDVIRYETLQFDLERICGRLGVVWAPARLPAFKVGIRPWQATAERLYTPRSRELVTCACRFELEHFGYEFPDAAPRRVLPNRRSADAW
jgi:hypothetical protein